MLRTLKKIVLVVLLAVVVAVGFQIGSGSIQLVGACGSVDTMPCQ